MPEYRFTLYPQSRSDCDPFISNPVKSQELAEGQMNLLVTYTQYLHEQSLMANYAHYGVLEKRNSKGIWEEVGEDEL